MKNTDLEIDNYYSRQRAWPRHFNIRKNIKVLDVGCGTGVLGSFFKHEYDAKVTGIEILEDCAKVARKTLDQVYCDNIEETDVLSNLSGFDYVVFSDSLEHLIDPEKTLINTQKVLKNEESSILVSVPNVRNFRVLVPLIFKGDWKYEDEGLLDKTHLRFFTRKSFLRALDDAGYKVTKIVVELPLKSVSGLLNVATFGFFEGFLTSHYYVQACLKKS
jgi:2-polyprenyl-3-methyl-5-hydroxy-6-metoxy-1,4-benzoquinol methylase